MNVKSRLALLTLAAVTTTLPVIGAHPAPAAGQEHTMDHSAAADAQGGNGADLGPGLFAAADANIDGAVTRAEFKATFEKWFSMRTPADRMPSPKRSF